MFRNVKISWKITIRLLLVVLLSVIAISYLSYNQSKELIKKRYTASFELVSSLKSKQIESIFASLQDYITQVASDPYIQKTVTELDDWDPILTPFIFDSVGVQLNGYFGAKKDLFAIEDIIITNAAEKVIYKHNWNTEPKLGQKDYPDFQNLFLNLRDSITVYPEGKAYFGMVMPSVAKSKPYLKMYVAHPIVIDNKNKGAVIFEFNVTKHIIPIVQDSTGLGSDGEIVLGRVLDGRRRVSIITEYTDGKGQVYAPTTYTYVTNNNYLIALQNATLGKADDFRVDEDDNNNQYLAYWRHLPTPNWGVVVQMPIEKVYTNLQDLSFQFVIFGLIILAISAFASYFILSLLTNPITIIKDRLKMVSQGILPENVFKESNDEIGEMAQAVKDLVYSLQQTANFAKQIGEGNYDASFTPMSRQDTLGNALLTMRDSIQAAEKKDKERNWIVTGIAEISQILRFRNNLEELGDDVLAFVTEKIGGIQGAFYTVEDEETNKPRIVMKASYAYHKKKYLQKEYYFAESLVGQCAIEKDTILRLEIPEDYMTISSGLLGDQKPNCLLFVPLITNNEQVYGVLEFAGFNRFSSTQIKFVEEISIIIARTIFNIKVNERTELMLQESQQLSEELQYQQEILRQNAEEMEATQEQLERTNSRLQKQIGVVENTQKRLELLLENASEVITIYKKDGTVRFISPSVQPILGYTVEELTGSEAGQHIHPDSVHLFKEMFEQILTNPTKGATVQYAYYKKDGETIWVESKGTNLLSNPAIQGILVNTRDITERRRAEKEERMRSAMQSLSENSLDLIVRVNSEGKFFYINPVIRKLTGRKKEYFLSRTLFDVKLHPDIVKVWKEAFGKVMNTKSKVSVEMDFPSVIGDRIMQLNAIPEFNDNHEVESVLLVVHDITESKQIEREIRTTNRKITESINYAKRIQSAILPDNEFVQSKLPESFVMYRPRDVVSGDFPWFLQKGDDFYIAAVDCTGHGVPGALISLIGYFILNDVVNTQQATTVGKILDLLHEGVTRTLRQDEKSQTRDGMDIALSKINLKEMKLEYAGAHRPLLHYSDDNGLMQIKGNRFPVGGGEYKIRTEFTTHTIELNKGDEIYLFSDGVTDQFGGADNRKFSIKKLRAMIEARTHKNMQDMGAILANSFEKWKGDKKQTDDVLVIGIKF
ncbi:MAG: PAS domain S-box protein [Flammeovirgaceae bacterium]